MNRKCQVIDADGHVLEPANLWVEGIDPKFRDRAPRLAVDTDGRERLLVEGKMLGNRILGLSVSGATGIPVETIRGMKYADGRKGGFDPHARIEDLDIDGIDAAVLYPTLGLF